MKKSIAFATLLICISVCSCHDSQEPEEEQLYVRPPASPITCDGGYHFYTKACEADSLEHCGSHDNNCLNIAGWGTGKCVDGECIIEACETGLSLKDNHCEIDIPDCCGPTCEQCPPNYVCSDGECKVNCSENTTFCDPFCIDLARSTEHCGDCDHNCNNEMPENGKTMRCDDGTCKLVSCADGLIPQDNICVSINSMTLNYECNLGSQLPCYTGDLQYMNIGECKIGYYPCIEDENGSRFWDTSECIGMGVPSTDYKCETEDQDLDCNGIPDSKQDQDGDGFTVCSMNGSPTDCCDNAEMCNTSQPQYVHPGQPGDCFGNQIDDNCNAQVDESPDIPCTSNYAECSFYNETCSSESDYQYNDSETAIPGKALDLAKAFDLCLPPVSVASSDPGILEFSLTQSGSSEHVSSRQVNVKSAMKDVSGNPLIVPQNGETFAILSSGGADDVFGTVSATDEHFNTGGTIPEVYSNAHNGTLQSHESCKTSSIINDSVHLHLKLRAPDSANGFKFDFRFFSREYPQFVCSTFNDFFLTLLTDENGKPFVDTNGNKQVSDEDGNITFDNAGNPISVNNSLFTTCAPRSCISKTCPANLTCNEKNECGSCPDGPDALAAYYPNPFMSSSSGGRGGGTAWLTTSAPVQPGQVFNLDFYIWDTGDSAYDSTVIIDNFRWTCSAQEVSTGYAQPGT